MTEKTWIEEIKVQGGQVLDTVQRILHEGNARRLVIKQDDRVVAEFPLTVGIVGALLAPTLAAIGALAALLTSCTIVVERTESAEAAEEEKPVEADSEAPSPMS